MFIAEDLKTVRDHIIKDVAEPKMRDFFCRSHDRKLST